MWFAIPLPLRKALVKFQSQNNHWCLLQWLSAHWSIRHKYHIECSAISINEQAWYDRHRRSTLATCHNDNQQEIQHQIIPAHTGCDHLTHTWQCRCHSCDCQITRYLTWYDTIRKNSLTWARKLSIQLNLTHVARKNIKKEKTKTTNQTYNIS